MSGSGVQPGRKYEVGFNLTCPSASVDPTSLTYKSLGMLRSKSLSVTNGDINTTADKSEGDFMTYIENYKEGTFSFDGVCYSDVIYNQRELYNHAAIEVTAPEAQGRVQGYISVTDPVWGQVQYIGVKFDDANIEAPYDGEPTFTISGKYLEKPVLEELTP